MLMFVVLKCREIFFILWVVLRTQVSSTEGKCSSPKLYISYQGAFSMSKIECHTSLQGRTHTQFHNICMANKFKSHFLQEYFYYVKFHLKNITMNIPTSDSWLNSLKIQQAPGVCCLPRREQQGGVSEQRHSVHYPNPWGGSASFWYT